MDKYRISNLELARMSTLSGDYPAALKIIDLLIRQSPNDIDALLLKGNTLELQLSSESEQSAHYVDLLNTARACYEKVLSLDPDNSFALKDLADHYGSNGEVEKALSLYRKLIGSLNHRVSLGENVNDELEEARAEYLELQKRE